MSEREKDWAAYRAWNKDFTGPIHFFNWDQWIAEYGFAVWQASRRAALEEIGQALTDAGEHSAYEIVYRALAASDSDGGKDE